MRQPKATRQNRIVEATGPVAALTGDRAAPWHCHCSSGSTASRRNSTWKRAAPCRKPSPDTTFPQGNSRAPSDATKTGHRAHGLDVSLHAATPPAVLSRPLPATARHVRHDDVTVAHPGNADRPGLRTVARIGRSAAKGPSPRRMSIGGQLSGGKHRASDAPVCRARHRRQVGDSQR